MAGLRHGKARHREQETRIDAVIAGLDALTAQRTGLRPFARCVRATAAAHYLENAADDVFGLCIRDAGRRNARTNLDALAASRAGVEHAVDVFVQSRFEWDVHWLTGSGPVVGNLTLQ
jgi:hypothetical protein